MSDAPNVAAEAPASLSPAPETPVVEAPVQPTETSSQDAMRAIYRSMQADEAEPGHEDAPEQAAEAAPGGEGEPAPEVEAAEPETAPETVPEAPSILPREVKEVWGAMSPEVRTAVEASQRQMSERLGDQGRTIKAMEPTMKAIKDIGDAHPDFHALQPADAAASIKNLLAVSQRLKESPAAGIAGIAREHGTSIQEIAEAMGLVPQQPGQPQPKPAPKTQQAPSISADDVARIAEERTQAVLHQRAMTDKINGYLEANGTWDTVDDDVETMIPAARKRLGDDAENFAVFEEAYRAAKAAFGPQDPPNPQPSAQKAQEQVAADEAATTPNPARAEAAQKAKKTNVKSSQTGKPHKLSSKEQMRAIYRAAHAE